MLNDADNDDDFLWKRRFTEIKWFITKQSMYGTHV